MYKVIIVDDEAISRVGIKGIICWEDYGFQVVGQASDGQSALELIGQIRPDLVLTDIRMPRLDGIGLIKACQEQGYDTEFVIISAFDDFQYLKSGMKLGAIDYILKNNINENQMVELLKSCSEKLSLKSRDGGGDHSHYQYDEHKVHHAIQQDYLKVLLYGKEEAQIAVEKIYDDFDLDLRKPQFCSFLVNGTEKNATYEFMTMIDILYETGQDYDGLYLCETGYRELTILYNLDIVSELEVKKRLRSMADRFVFVIKQYMNVEIKIGISDVLNGLANVPLTYLEAYQSSNSDYNVGGRSGPMFYGEIKDVRSQILNVDLEKAIRQFRRAIEAESHELIIENMTAVVEGFCDKAVVNRGQLHYYFSAFMYNLKDYASGKSLYRLEEAISVIEGQGELTQLSAQKVTTEILPMLKSILVDELAKLEETSVYVIKVKEIIRKKYHEKLSVEILADEIGLSYTYLSTLFKKETGSTIQEFIIAKRVLEAKKLLRKTTRQVRDIASEVGYDNENYFSRMFKNRTGMSALAYRNNK